jgi:hypothetical protein
VRNFLLSVFTVLLALVTAGCPNPGDNTDDTRDQAGSTPGNPVTRVETSPLGWEYLLISIASEAKYVNLDLSACISNTQFDLNTDDSVNPGLMATAKGLIVSLVLPNTATSIKASSWNASTLTYTGAKDFANLTSVTGANITSIGQYAFSSCSALKTASFPKLTIIDRYAFDFCTGLSAVNFPAAAIIGEHAFAGCGFTTVSLPAATSIGDYAFSSCASLTAVTLPELATMGSFSSYASAFSFCPLLVTYTLGDTPPEIKPSSWVSGTTPKTYTIKRPAASAAAYTSWKTANSAKFGSDIVTFQDS